MLGRDDSGERDVLLQHLGDSTTSERGLLTNARCLAEGVDVPTLDGVAFIDPRRSEVDIVQAVGRAIRKADDKTVGTIVIPVFIDTDADPEAALDESAFKPVWDVIKALRAHDEALGEELDALRRAARSTRPASTAAGQDHFDIPRRSARTSSDAFDVRLSSRPLPRGRSILVRRGVHTRERGTNQGPYARIVASDAFDGYKSATGCQTNEPIREGHPPRRPQSSD